MVKRLKLMVEKHRIIRHLPNPISLIEELGVENKCQYFLTLSSFKKILEIIEYLFLSNSCGSQKQI